MTMSTSQEVSDERPENPTHLPELVDLIVDCLSSEKAALKSCSLVGRAWLPRSRFHLFHTIHLNIADPFANRDFLKLHGSTLSTLSTHVHHLIIHESRSTTSMTRRRRFLGGIQGCPLDEFMSSRSFCALVAKSQFLPFVQTLSLRSIFWELDSHSSSTFQQAFRLIQTLNFDTTCFTDVVELMHIVNSLHELSTLCLRSISFRDLPGSGLSKLLQRNSGSKSEVLPSSLRSVLLQDVPTDVYEWLRLPEQPLNLRTLSLNSTPRVKEPVLALLHRLEHSLHHLQISYDDITAEKYSDNYTSIPRFAKLRSICFTDIRIHAVSKTCRKIIPHLLSQIPSTRMTEVSFKCRFDGTGMLTPEDMLTASMVDVLDYEALSEVLGRKQYQGLQRLSFFCPSDHRDELVEELGKRLAQLHDRGAISVIGSSNID